MNHQRISHKDFFTSVSLVLLSTIGLAISAGFWKYLTTLGSLELAIFIRFFFPSLLISIWVLVKRLKIEIRSIWPHILRAIIVFAAQYAFFYVLSRKDLLLATLLYLTSGLFSPLLLYIVFKTRVSKRTLISIIVSFVGVAIALGTWNNIIEPISLIGLLSGLLTATGRIIQHRIAKSDDIFVMNFMLFNLCSLFSILLLFLNPTMWHTDLNTLHHLSFIMLGIILAFACLNILNQTLKNAAFKYVHKVTSLVPFFYAAIIFSGIIDWLWHDIIPQLHNIIGVCIIIIGGVIMSVRKLST